MLDSFIDAPRPCSPPRRYSTGTASATGVSGHLKGHRGPQSFHDPKPASGDGARMNLFGWLVLSNITPAEIRAEIWSLGGRHQGAPLEGALKELKAPGLTRRRSDLLRAVVDQLRAA